MMPSITRDRVPAGSAVKAAARRLRRWPSASLDRLRPLALMVAVIERRNPSPADKPSFNSSPRARQLPRRAGWMVTVPPLGQPTGRFVDGSHPRGFLTASMRNVGTDPSGPTGYEVMQ
jgi:hypothetical protein